MSVNLSSFSECCQYGCKSGSQRITAHEDLIAHLRSAGKVMFLAENEALDFVRGRALARNERDAGDGFAVLPRDPRFAMERRGSAA